MRGEAIRRGTKTERQRPNVREKERYREVAQEVKRERGKELKRQTERKCSPYSVQRSWVSVMLSSFSSCVQHSEGFNESRE